MSNIHTKLPFIDPFVNIEVTRRLVSDVDATYFNDVYCIRPIKGTLQTTINILWKKFHDALPKYGITTIQQQERFERFITECRIVWDEEDNDNGGGTGVESSAVQRSAVVGVVPKTETPNVPGRTDCGSEENKVITNKPADIPRGVRKGRGNVGTKGKKR